MSGGESIDSSQQAWRAAFARASTHQFPSQVVYRPALINGEPGLLRYVGGQIESAQSFIVDEGRMVAVFVMRNPDKLTSAPQFI